VDRQAILGGSAPRESYLRDPAPFVRENIGRHTDLVPLRTEARALHPMMGPWASHSGSCDHHKSRGALGFTHN
jgi:hypothetical protein